MKNLSTFFKLYRPSILVFIIAGIIGALIFVSIFGTSVINTGNVQWIQADEGDFSQHYLGWLFYRQGDWSPILGSISSLAYPHGIALTFMDSIPLLAIPFKVISPLLPETFQYFGLWGLLSYTLMGGIGGLIMLRLTRNIPFAILASLIFSYSPIVIQRMYSHTALAGHWILLAGIFLLVRLTKNSRISRFIFWWSIVLGVSACIHPYFIPMNFALMLMSAVLTFKKPLDLALRVIIPTLFAVSVFAGIGGFSVSEISTGGARDFGLNANSLIDPMGFSGFITPRPAVDGSYEAFSYLGIGLFLLGAVVAYGAFVASRNLSMRRVGRSIKLFFRSRWLIVSLIALGVLVASVGPTINIGTHTLDLYIPASVEEKWSIFRATGRLFWPLYYLIVIGILYAAYKLSVNKMTGIVLLCFFSLFVFVQIVDISNGTHTYGKHVRFNNAAITTYDMGVDQVRWNPVAVNKKHIQYIGSADRGSFFPIAYFATEHRLTMSDGYYARSPYAAIAETSSGARRALLTGQARDDTIYITKDDEVISFAKASQDLTVIRDGPSYLIITKQ